nr:MAG TPA: hypothetical protein [Caudoviricetes sp.]
MIQIKLQDVLTGYQLVTIMSILDIERLAKLNGL